eukprot:364988-Chlamydomonas_euryale.AAC.25
MRLGVRVRYGIGCGGGGGERRRLDSTCPIQHLPAQHPPSQHLTADLRAAPCAPEWAAELAALRPRQLGSLLTARHADIDVAEFVVYARLAGQVTGMGFKVSAQESV